MATGARLRLGWAFLDERPTPTACLGMALVGLGLLFLNGRAPRAA